MGNINSIFEAETKTHYLYYLFNCDEVFLKEYSIICAFKSKCIPLKCLFLDVERLDFGRNIEIYH